MRIGQGYDSHRLAFNKPLILGGVKIDFAKGATGHSDADTLAHAVIDALLGAAGLGDIGMRFPDGDMRYKGANSMSLMQQVAGLVKDAGYKVANIDATVVLEQPKLGRLKAEMAASIATALGVPAFLVNVKAKTAEGLGPVGTGEAVEAHAIALIEEVKR